MNKTMTDRCFVPEDHVVDSKVPVFREYFGDQSPLDLSVREWTSSLPWMLKSTHLSVVIHAKWTPAVSDRRSRAATYQAERVSTVKALWRSRKVEYAISRLILSVVFNYLRPNDTT